MMLFIICRTLLYGILCVVENVQLLLHFFSRCANNCIVRYCICYTLHVLRCATVMRRIVKFKQVWLTEFVRNV